MQKYLIIHRDSVRNRKFELSLPLIRLALENNDRKEILMMNKEL